MILDWEEVLPAAVKDLQPFHRELVEYIANLSGKRRPAYTYAKRTWNLDKDAFDAELQAALSALRKSLNRRGIHRYADLEMQ